MNRIWYVLLCSSLLLAGISAKAQNNEVCPDQASLVNETMNRITEVIVHDVFTPPVASRIYAYTAIAGYSAYHFIQGETPFTVKLNEFPELPLSSPNQPYCASLAMSSAMFETAKALLFSEAMVDSSSFTDFTAIYFEDKLDEKTRQTSINYGRFVARSLNGPARTTTGETPQPGALYTGKTGRQLGAHPPDKCRCRRTLLGTDAAFCAGQRQPVPTN